MEFHCKPPKELSLNGNISENWRKFKQSFDICLKASGNIEKSNEIKVAILLNIVGEDGIELYNSFNLQETERNDLTKVLQCFEEYCISKKNTAYESFKFFSRVQQEGENFESFLMEIKKLSQTCEFGIMSDRMIRDKIVQGIKDKVLQERLLKIEDLNVQKAIDYCRAAEASNIQARSLQENKTEIDNLHKEMLQEFNKIRGEEITQKFDCKKYETKHDPRGYLTSEEKRKQCSKFNHFAISCKAKKIKDLTN